MPRTKMEWKVGLFVFIGLVLLAVLMLNFSKGLSLFEGTYELRLVAANVAGIKPKAAVMVSGVKVGSVVNSTLSTNGSVVIRMEILDDFKIDREATFVIDSLGFLGDQYVGIVSTNDSGHYLTNNEVVYCEAPLNLQEAIRSTAGLLHQAQTTMQTLDVAISNVNRTVLNDATLSSFSRSITNLQTISASAQKTLGKIDMLVETNSPALGASVSNIYGFTSELRNLLATNENDISVAVKNLRTASASLNELLDGVKATNGPAGLLLRDQQMTRQLTSLVTNVNSVAENFSVFSSNLNNRGIWSMLWKPKPPKKSASGKDR